MKIIFPSVFYLPNELGGIELYIQHLAKGLLKKGFEVKVAVPAFTDEDFTDYEFEGVPVIRYKGYTTVGKLQISGLQANESLTNFKLLLQKEKPDIVHFSQITNSSGIGLQHIEAAKELGAKIVFTSHMSEFICQRGNLMYMGESVCDGIVSVKKCTACMMHSRGFSKPTAHALSIIDQALVNVIGKDNFLRQVQPLVLPGFYTRWHVHKVTSIIAKADAFVSIAAWSSTLLKENGWYKSNCTTIKTGLLNITVASKPFDNKYDGKRPLKIIYAGRIAPVKGIDMLINAVKNISPNLIQLNIFGPRGTGIEGEYFDRCKKIAKDNPNIIFHGQIQNDQVVNKIAENDLFCLPSRGNEMAPLVIQEAMAANVPVIGANLPAIREWVTDGFNGVIFNVGDETELRNKIMSVLNNSSLVQEYKINMLAPRLFDKVVDEYSDLYRSFFSGNSPC